MSPATHDLLFTVTIVILFFCTLPTVKARTVMPVWTGVGFSFAMFLFGFNYFTMSYWFSAAVEALCMMEWLFLLFLAVKASRPFGSQS